MATAVSVLPALMIFWLSRVTKTEDRIYITIGMTGGLGLFMRLVIRANVKEILAATLGYVARGDVKHRHYRTP